MKRSLLVILLIINTLQGFSVSFDSTAVISLLTCSEGTDFYASFGHSAMRIKDSSGTDIVCNWGLFDFNTPNFYWKFAQGRLKYSMGIESFEDFIAFYKYDKRKVWEQEFLINNKDKMKLLALVEENYRPENRKYKYEFVYNNCATIIADHTLEATRASTAAKTEPKTFRNLLYNYLEKKPWVQLGIDILLGSRLDQKATLKEQMFLPENLANNLTLYQSDSGNILGPKKLLFDKSQKAEKIPNWYKPKYMLAFILTILLLVFYYSKLKVFRVVLPNFLFIVLGLLGLFLLFMWFGTEHSAPKANYNLLWANPLFLLLPFLKDFRKYKVVSSVLLIGLIFVLFSWAPQQFPTPRVPISLFLILLLMRHYKRKSVKPPSQKLA